MEMTFKITHRCEPKTPRPVANLTNEAALRDYGFLPWGESPITNCYGYSDGRMFVVNRGGYISLVDYCPFCGGTAEKRRRPQTSKPTKKRGA